MMELISRENLLYNLSQYLLQESPVDETDKDKILVSEAIRECMKAIQKEPTIEGRPEGEWVGIDEEPYEEWECNNCGNIITNVDVYELEYHKYCHNCGAEMSTPWADMRGEE